MLRFILSLVLISHFAFTSFSQIEINPEFPSRNQMVTLTFDASKGGGGLKDFDGNIYAHTGLITSKSTSAGDWKYVAADWGQNLDALKMKRVDQNTYSLNFKINELYKLPPDEEIVAFAFVFRNEDGSLVGKAIGNSDIFYYLDTTAVFETKKIEVFEKSQAAHPSWADNATLYEVNIRQYTKEGTFEAFRKHLPRLKAMGVDILWFMPIHPIGVKNRKGSLGSYYSIKDYKGINPEFGSIEDFKKLVDEIHSMDMKVIIDWVANHSAWDHEWVEKYPDWYVRDEDGNIHSPFDWTDVAELNFEIPEMRMAMIDAMRYWVKDIDIDGFRCDVAGEVPSDFWEDVRPELDEIKSIWMLAEDESQSWLLNKAFNANYGWSMHHTMNEIAKGNLSPNYIYADYSAKYDQLPTGSYPMQFITNHDENSWNGTISERLGDAHDVFAVLYYTLPGIPLIYSGQEAGLDHRLLFFEKDEIDWSDVKYEKLYTDLNRLKEENTALWNGATGGDLRGLKNDKPESVLSYVRQNQENKVLAILNLSNKRQLVNIPTNYEQGVYRDFFSGDEIDIDKKLSVELEPGSYKVLTLIEEKKRELVSVEYKNSQLTVVTSDGDIRFTPLADHSIEVEFQAPDHTNPPSYALQKQSTSVATNFYETESKISYATGKLEVEITKEPFDITYYSNGLELTSEDGGYFYDFDKMGFAFSLKADEKVLGGGERVLGMDRRGKRLKLFNQASYGYETHADLMYYSLPIALSSRNYLLLFDNGSSGFMDIGFSEEDKLQFEAIGGRMSYVIVAGDDWEDVTRNYTEITGRQEMLPRWALGNIASRMGYHTQNEVETVVDKYKKDRIPLDAVVLDIYWFGPDLKGHLGNLEWDLEAWPQPEKMMADFKKEGVKTILITEPFVIQKTKKYQEVIDKGLVGVKSNGEPYIFDFYFGTTTLLDIFKRETKDWFWEIYKRHTKTGVDGWWGDLGEPEVHPDDLLHVNGRADEVHNLYGHEWCKLVWDGYEKDFPNVRPVILMRSGFAGTQRYGIIPWSGDVNRSWGGLKPQVEIGLSMGMQGLAYMHSDLGGFAGAYEDAELYTRWLQYGVFQPVYRTHAQEEVPAEPVFWDEETKRIARNAIQLRYALLPYNYTLMFINSQRGIPMMRPLAYLKDPKIGIEHTAEYMWGDAFLVSPVIEKGQKSKSIYLPSGHVWVDLWTDKVHPGGQTIEQTLTKENIPVFVKAGSFIPLAPVFSNTEMYNTEKLYLHYYHHPNITSGKGVMYEDDGKTKNAFEKGQFEILMMNSEYKKGKLKISIEEDGGNYSGKVKDRLFEIVIHGVKKEPKKVKIKREMKSEKDAKSEMTFDAQTGQLKIMTTLDKRLNIEILE
ncbi:MAG: DUF5110 domain-containing protein [Chitinophagales bacterium]|nr:DUF5110 domain-containing protein [Chitinophagales bacterium]